MKAGPEATSECREFILQVTIESSKEEIKGNKAEENNRTCDRLSYHSEHLRLDHAGNTWKKCKNALQNCSFESKWLMHFSTSSCYFQLKAVIGSVNSPVIPGSLMSLK